MKKVLGISLVAVLAVSPLMAKADNITPLVFGATTDVATTSYVMGAYNALGEVINTKQNQLVNDALVPANISDTVLTTVRAANVASDTNLVTEKAVASAVANAIAGQNFNGFANTDLSNLSETGTAVITNAANTAAGTAEQNAKDYTNTALGAYTNTTNMNAAIATAKSGAESTAAADATTKANAAEAAAKSYADSLVTGLGISGYATKDGVKNTVNSATATGKIKIAQTWGSSVTIDHDITSDVSVGAYVPEEEEEED